MKSYKSLLLIPVFASAATLAACREYDDVVTVAHAQHIDAGKCSGEEVKTYQRPTCADQILDQVDGRASGGQGN